MEGGYDNTTSGSIETYRTPGPLLTSIQAIFGNNSNSFFYTVANSFNENQAAWINICHDFNLPFARLGKQFGIHWQPLCEGIFENDDFPDPVMMESFNVTSTVELLDFWLADVFNSTDTAADALSVAMYLVNKQILSEILEVTWDGNARKIYTAPGETVLKPTVSLAGIITVSVLILLQIISLIYVTWYIYQTPTWTSVLDALAVARLGASMGRELLLPLRPPDLETLAGLENVNGLVGIIGTSSDKMDNSHASIGGTRAHSLDIQTAGGEDASTFRRSRAGDRHGHQTSTNGADGESTEEAVRLLSADEAINENEHRQRCRLSEQKNRRIPEKTNTNGVDGDATRAFATRTEMLQVSDSTSDAQTNEHRANEKQADEQREITLGLGADGVISSVHAPMKDFKIVRKDFKAKAHQLLNEFTGRV